MKTVAPDHRSHGLREEAGNEAPFDRNRCDANHRVLAAPSRSQQLSKSGEWTKTYVVEWNEPAMYYGAKTGVIDPGTDCPKGTNPEIDWIKVLVDAGYTHEEAKWLRNPANPTRSPVHGQNQMAFRGKDRANVYVNPTSTPDPGLVGVSRHDRRRHRPRWR